MIDPVALFEAGHRDARAGEAPGRGGAGGASADDQDIGVAGRVRRLHLKSCLCFEAGMLQEA
jgi:hypothetical protein